MIGTVDASASTVGGFVSWWRLLHCVLLPCRSGRQPQHSRPADDAWAQHRFATFLAGNVEVGDVGHHDRPDWLDEKKLARARELHRQYWPLMNNAQVMSLLLSFTFFENTKPLIFTGRSDTAPRARRRYLETALHVHSWALGDIWLPDDEAYKNAQRVRAMHSGVARALSGRNLTSITRPGQLPPLSSLCRHPAHGNNDHLARHTGAATAGGDDGDDDGGGDGDGDGRGPTGTCPFQAISQRGMAATQWFFVGLIVLHPEKFGLGHLSDEDLESFLHLWRSIGHRLGVAEQYNLCSGSLAQVRALARLVEQRYLLPQLARPAADWDAMTRALYDGLADVFWLCRHSVFRYYLLHDVLQLQADAAYRALSWSDAWRYRLLRATFQRASQDSRLRQNIRADAKAQFEAGARTEQLPEHLTYIFDLI